MKQTQGWQAAGDNQPMNLGRAVSRTGGKDNSQASAPKAKRIFILHSNTGVTAPSFSETTLTTEGGRMDVVARSLISALYDTSSPRQDTLFIAVLHGPPTPPLSLYLRPLPQLKRKPSEREVAALLLQALKKPDARTLEVKREKTTEVVSALRNQGYRVHLLVEEGSDVRDVSFSDKNAFVLGDHIGFSPKVQRELEQVCDVTLSLGRISYLTSHCILYIHELLDRKEHSETSLI